MQVVEVKTCLEKAQVPKNCRKRLIEWCHKALQHRGKESIMCAIGNDFKWPGWMPDVDRFASRCESCQNARQQEPKTMEKCQ